MFFEIATAITIAGIFFILGIMAQIISIAHRDKKEHERNLERIEKEHIKKIDYMKKEIFFQRKLNFLETILVKVDKNESILNEMIILLKSEGGNSWEKLMTLLNKLDPISPGCGHIYSNLNEVSNNVSQFLNKSAEILGGIADTNDKGNVDKDRLEKIGKLIPELSKINTELTKSIRDELRQK